MNQSINNVFEDLISEDSKKAIVQEILAFMQFGMNQDTTEYDFSLSKDGKMKTDSDINFKFNFDVDLAKDCYLYNFREKFFKLEESLSDEDIDKLKQFSDSIITDLNSQENIKKINSYIKKFIYNDSNAPDFKEISLSLLDIFQERNIPDFNIKINKSIPKETLESGVYNSSKIASEVMNLLPMNKEEATQERAIEIFKNLKMNYPEKFKFVQSIEFTKVFFDCQLGFYIDFSI